MYMKRRIVWSLLVMAAVMAITLVLGLQLRGMKIEGGTVFLPPNSPVERQIGAMERLFGSSEIISVMMQQDSGTVFNPLSLALINRISAELQALPGVEEVRSIANTDFMEGRTGGMTVSKLMPRVPATQAEADLVRERAQSWELYRGLLVSRDMKAAQWVITLTSDPETAADYGKVVTAIQSVTARYSDPTRHFMLAGEVAVKALLVSGITRDLTFLLPVLLVVLVAILYFAFRTVSGVILPLATVVLSTVWTMGLMALFGVPINIMGTAIPLLLVTVGSAYGIHFLSHYYEELARPRPPGPPNAGIPVVLRRTYKRVGLPILLAGVTTIAGFGSLGSASIPAILQMGIFTAVGIFCALVLTFTFVPAVLVLHRRAPRTSASASGPVLAATSAAAEPSHHAVAAGHTEHRRGRTSHALMTTYSVFARRPALLVAVVILLAGASAVGIAKIQVGQPTVNFFRASSPIRAASRFADENFGGSTVMYVVVKMLGSPPADNSTGRGRSADARPTAAPPAGGAEGGFGSFGDLSKIAGAAPAGAEGTARTSIIDPAVLGSVVGLADHLKSTYPAKVGSVTSLATMIEQMNRVMHDGQDDYYEIPSVPAKYGLSDQLALRRLIAQYLLLYSGSLGSFVDSTDHPTALRVVVQLKDSNPAFLDRVKKDILRYGSLNLRPLGYSIETVGLPDEMLAMNASIMRSQIVSVAIALVCVMIAMWAAYGSLVIGLAGLIPIALSLLLNFAAMGFLHIPLDIVTAIIASVAIGIGIDYSIHVVSAYVFEYRLTGDCEISARRTFALTGRAIFFNVASVTVGFAVLVFSMFTPLNSVGILMGVIMITSSFFSLTLLPVVLRSVVPGLSRSVPEAERTAGSPAETAARRSV